MEVSFTVNDNAPKTNGYVDGELGQRVSKLAAVVGANAAGKTNLLKVLPFIKWMIVGSYSQDPDKKMSKSDDNEKNYVSIIDDAKKIEKKIKSATTDSGTDIKFDPENKAGLSNLMTIYSVLGGKTIAQIEKDYEGKMYGHLKVDLAELVVETLKPVRVKYDDLMKNRDHLDQLMKSGAERAQVRAQKTLENVYQTIGLIPRK